MFNAFHYFLAFLVTGFAVLAACLKALAVGLPLAPAFFIVSPEPALMRFSLAAMFLYRLKLILLPLNLIRPISCASLALGYVLAMPSFKTSPFSFHCG